ncbi:MAG TPA: hypothetical protein VGF62_08945, partial [Rhizomicrobium sp.]
SAGLRLGVQQSMPSPLCGFLYEGAGDSTFIAASPGTQPFWRHFPQASLALRRVRSRRVFDGSTFPALRAVIPAKFVTPASLSLTSAAQRA